MPYILIYLAVTEGFC